VLVCLVFNKSQFFFLSSDFNPSVTLEFKFQLLNKMDDLHFYTKLKFIDDLRCTEAGNT